MKVLLVEDSRFTRSLLRRELSVRHEVMEARDGLEGQSAFVEFQPDIVLLDLQMPRVDGFQFITYLQGQAFQGPIIVCSANTQSSVKRRVYELGATLFVPKPDLLTRGRSLDILEEAASRHQEETKSAPKGTGRSSFTKTISAAQEVFKILSGLDAEVLDLADGLPPESYAGQSGLRVVLSLSGLITGTAILQLSPPAHLLGTGALVCISTAGDTETIARVAREVTGTLAARLSQIHGFPVQASLSSFTELMTGNDPPEPNGVVIAARLHFEGSEEIARLTVTMHLPAIVELVAHLGMPRP